MGIQWVFVRAVGLNQLFKIFYLVFSSEDDFLSSLENFFSLSFNVDDVNS